MRSGVYPSEAPVFNSPIGWALGLTHKHWTSLERLARDKHSSLYRKSINYRKKSFIRLATGVNVIKLFCPYFANFSNELERLSLASLCLFEKYSSFLFEKVVIRWALDKPESRL